MFFRCDGRVRLSHALVSYLVEAECPAALTAERYARSNPPLSPPAPLPGRGESWHAHAARPCPCVVVV